MHPRIGPTSKAPEQKTFICWAVHSVKTVKEDRNLGQHYLIQYYFLLSTVKVVGTVLQVRYVNDAL